MIQSENLARTPAPAASSRDELLKVLAARIDSTLSDLVESEVPFALLDFPNYDNVGDSAIYVGEIAYFDSRRMTPSYVCSADSYDHDELNRAIQGGPIFMNGGGNFGDLWTWAQSFRHQVLSRNRARKVVQLPQTIYFSSEAALDETARVIERHGAFTLLVRDQRSFELARKKFACEVRLCPDMALCMGKLGRPVPQFDLLFHLRQDKEAMGAHQVDAVLARTNSRRADWPREFKGFGRIAQLRALARAARTGETFLRDPNLRRERYFRALSQQRLRRGIELLGSARMVITDRLHGHILSVLMGLPHCVLDNNYGKISSFMAAWGTKVAHTHSADSAAEAVELLRAHEGLRVS
jgi:pyruvyl transferase EpsO